MLYNHLDNPKNKTQLCYQINDMSAPRVSLHSSVYSNVFIRIKNVLKNTAQKQFKEHCENKILATYKTKRNN